MPFFFDGFVRFVQSSNDKIVTKGEMGLCGSIPEDEVEVEDTVESCDLKEVGKMARPRLILAKCTEDDVTDRYTIPLKTISTGNMTGDIVVVRERRTKNEFALKTIQKRDMSEKMLNILRREVEILASLDHVRFLSFVSFQFSHTHILSTAERHTLRGNIRNTLSNFDRFGAWRRHGSVRSSSKAASRKIQTLDCV